MRLWVIAAVSIFAVAELRYIHRAGDPRVESANFLGTLLPEASMPASSGQVQVSTRVEPVHKRSRRVVGIRRK